MPESSACGEPLHKSRIKEAQQRMKELHILSWQQHRWSLRALKFHWETSKHFLGILTFGELLPEPKEKMEIMCPDI